MTQDFQQYFDFVLMPANLKAQWTIANKFGGIFTRLGVYLRNRLKAHLWTLHAAVAGEKVAAETLRDAVSLVLTHELTRVKLKHTMMSQHSDDDDDDDHHTWRTGTRLELPVT